MKILIAIPTLDYVHVDFMKSLLALTEAIECPHEISIQSGTLVYMAREKLANKAINEGFDFVLWLDSDMVFQPTLLEDLQFSRKDFITGVYQARRPGFTSCIFEKIDLDSFRSVERYPSDIFRVEGCGFGCVLIKTEILKHVMQTYKTCFMPIKGYGEDIAFCLRARDLGYKLYCDPHVVCGHIGHVTIFPEDRENYLARMEAMQ